MGKSADECVCCGLSEVDFLHDVGGGPVCPDCIKECRWRENKECQILLKWAAIRGEYGAGERLLLWQRERFRDAAVLAMEALALIPEHSVALNPPLRSAISATASAYERALLAIEWKGKKWGQL